MFQHLVYQLSLTLLNLTADLHLSQIVGLESLSDSRIYSWVWLSFLFLSLTAILRFSYESHFDI